MMMHHLAFIINILVDTYIVKNCLINIQYWSFEQEIIILHQIDYKIVGRL